MDKDLNRLLEREKSILAPYAVASLNSDGRVFKERKMDDRLPFQKDRDRIIHCKSFRRLNEKTQVFVAGSGDHYRTRLTHSLEVAQVSRDTARLLGLNEDLAEAIALAHDLGHPPFAHVGQDTLHEIMKKFGLHFEHNDQSRRIVEKLEKLYPEFDGLNLTVEVIDGLMKHQTPWDQPKTKFTKHPHLEGQLVNLGDEIAYTCHDIDDGLRSGIISTSDLSKTKLWQQAVELAEIRHGKIEDLEILKYRSISALLSILMHDVEDQTFRNLNGNDIKSLNDVRNFNGTLVEFTPKTSGELAELRKFLYQNFYLSPGIIAQFASAKEIMQAIFDYYLKSPHLLPSKYQYYLSEGERVEIVVKDYLAGMTDGFLKQEFERLSNM